MDNWKKYGKPLIGFAISTAVVFGSMNVWILTIASPIFVLLVFKVLGVWKSKERGIYGSIAIVLGVMLFFLAFSYHVGDMPQGTFDKNGIKVVIEPYSTKNMNAKFNITATYQKATNSSMSYEVTDISSYLVVDRGSVNGIIENNKTVYHFQLNLPRGIYNITLNVDNNSIYISAIKEDPIELFKRYVTGPGVYLSMLLAALYLLLVTGIHITRKGYKMGLRYEKKK